MSENKKELIKKEVKEIMNILDNQENIETSPYLFTKIKSRIKDGDRKNGVFLFFQNNSLFLITTLLIILNIISIMVFFKNLEKKSYSSKSYVSYLTDNYYISSYSSNILINLKDK